MSDSMICANGHEVSKGAVFCRECGVSVAPAVSETTTEYDDRPNQNYADDRTVSAPENPKPILKEKTPTKSKVPIIGALAGLALIGGVAGAVMHERGGDADTIVATPAITPAAQQAPSASNAPVVKETPDQPAPAPSWVQDLARQQPPSQTPSQSPQQSETDDVSNKLDVSAYTEIVAGQIGSLLEPCTNPKYVAPLGCEIIAWEDTNYTAMSQLERNWLQYPEVVLAPSWQSPSDVARNGAADIGIDEDMQAVLVNGVVRLNYFARNTSAENWQGPLSHEIPLVDANGEPIAFPVVFDSSGWPLVFDDAGLLNHCNTACMRAGQGDASGKVEAQTPTTTSDSAHPGPWMMHLTCTDKPGRGIQWSSDANGDPVGDDVEIAAPSCDVGLTSDLPKAGANCYWITNAYNHNTLSDHVNIRSSQSSESPSNIIGEIPAGAGPFDFEVCGQEGWVRARYNGILGWVSNSLDIR